MARVFLSDRGARLDGLAFECSCDGPRAMDEAAHVLSFAEPTDRDVVDGFEYDQHPVAHRRKVGSVHVHAVAYRPFGYLANAIEAVLLPALDRLISEGS